jgi:phosphopantothenoylcysteine decarboxylase/phosphopantothenate--cysteine ligase
VGTALWSDWPRDEEAGEYARFPHLDFARGVDAVVIAPATASVLGKVAGGIGDDLLTTTLLAVDPASTPVLFVPSMNRTMWEHPAVRANREVLRARGYGIITPDEGPLACGEYGIGRWPGNEAILMGLDRLVNGRARLEGKRVVVTAGATESNVDPVRTLTNRSSGKMGFALARALFREGAQVTLIHGVTRVAPPPFVERIAVRTPEEMGAAVGAALAGAAQLWMAAAVGDWRPAEPAAEKRKKGEWDGVLRLEPTEDILARAAVEREPGTLLVGFAVETGDMERKAAEKLARKGCDLIVANDPLEEGAGFEHDTNRVLVLGPGGERREFPLMTKEELAGRLVEYVLERAGAASPAAR